MLDATAHFEAVRDRLPGGPEVLQARKTALARAEQNGLPTRRNENWHYTDLARLLKQNQATPVRANAFDAGALSPLQMMFENGVLINEPRAMIAQALRAWLVRWAGACEPRGQRI